MRETIGVREGLGLGLAVLTGLLIVRPGIAEPIGIQSVLLVTDNSYHVIAGIAAVGVFYALYIGMTWWVAGGGIQTDPPTVETFAETAIPGSEFDEALPELAGKRGRAVRPVEHRELIRERLRKDAIRTVARVENIPDEEATAMVDAGDWTNNRYASAFVGDETVPGPRWIHRLRDTLLRRDAFSRRARETVLALRELEGTDL